MLLAALFPYGPKLEKQLTCPSTGQWVKMKQKEMNCCGLNKYREGEKEEGLMYDDLGR